MLDYQLNLAAILRRAEQHWGHKEIASRLPDRSFHRYSYAELGSRVRRLASALLDLGLRESARVATLCWTHHQHLEIYYAGPISGNVTHPINPRLHPSDVSYISSHADDTVLIVDQSLIDLYNEISDLTSFEHVVVIGDAPEGTIDYEELLAAGDPEWQPPDIDERRPAFTTYTSGTTGQPKGVWLSHRELVLHSLGSAMNGWLALREDDVVLPVVPMFHALAWGYPFSCALMGAKQVLPGPFLDPVSLLEVFEQERVTMTGGVPTVWLGVLGTLDDQPGTYDLSSMRAILSGGSTAPVAMIDGFRERHGLNLLHTWGMTELCMGAVADPPGDVRDQSDEEQMRYRAKQGLPMPLVEIRARGEKGLVPWDGQTMGELEVRGAWVAGGYADAPDAADRWADDGWFRTGDIVTIDWRGCMEIQDRAKDLVKSGGEWISSVALENSLMGHPAVAEAAVIAVPDEKWSERPMAIVARKEGESVSAEELREFVAPSFSKWWLPDRIEFIEEIPKTAVGKYRKTELRERFGHSAAPRRE